jgi:hypothetical protein
MPHAGRDIPEPGHLSPAAEIDQNPGAKLALVHEDRHNIVGKNNSPNLVETATTRKDGRRAEAGGFSGKVSCTNTPPAYLSRAAVLGSLHHNNSSCIRLGKRVRDLD